MKLEFHLKRLYRHLEKSSKVRAWLKKRADIVTQMMLQDAENKGFDSVEAMVAHEFIMVHLRG